MENVERLVFSLGNINEFSSQCPLFGQLHERNYICNVSAGCPRNASKFQGPRRWIGCQKTMYLHQMDLAVVNKKDSLDFCSQIWNIYSWPTAGNGYKGSVHIELGLSSKRPNSFALLLHNSQTDSLNRSKQTS